jgi:heme exporter protein C
MVEYLASRRLRFFDKSTSMAQTMLWGMLLMALCFWMYSIAVGLMRLRAIILEREAHTDWVRQLSEVKS